MTENIKINKNQLVSVIVVTYNSSKFIRETLESIKLQSYSNIELIISDDCSSDNTIEICQKWLEENKSRFTTTKLITVSKNTGIPANCNRGLNESHGSLLKFIAGDDVILPDFICESLNAFQTDSQVAVTYTSSKTIDEKGQVIKSLPTEKYKSGFIFEELFFVKFWPAAPSFMFTRQAVMEVGGFDESIVVEDYLLVLKLAQKYKIQHINKFLTYYRIHSSNTSKNNDFLFKGHLDTINRFKNYGGYKKRMRQLKVSMINSYSRRNKKEALNLIVNNLNTISFKTIWVIIFLRLIIPYKYHNKVFKREIVN
ncbi:Glycosyl transferase family 2 [Mariniphaga anaerophila]|uniref:Glycosyl transferase family 2 n=1 Tax=Mariniphaga anaerophila TaxID=1484053 RepID=A0A1M5BM49_9BACT|nr:glycosyltransferase [Mariniphaga anaerophila]SHF43476.1 Glycosyl transferase family 2 [Mariniphaga anaerophila]